MSLTRAEWCAMWDAIKRIELNTKGDRQVYITNKSEYFKSIEFIKNKIQQVIGQME